MVRAAAVSPWAPAIVGRSGKAANKAWRALRRRRMLRSSHSLFNWRAGLRHNALRFCCEGVRRSRAGYSRIYLVRLRRAYALASSKRGLGGWPSTPGQNFEEATRSRSLIEVNTAGKHEVVDGVQN